MIYVLAKNAPTLFVMLSEADITEKLRPGRTLYVDPSMLQNMKFDTIIISLSKTDQDSVEMLKKADPEGMRTAPFTTKEVGTGEARCGGCKGVMPFASLFEGTCTVCWATEAKNRRKESN